MYPDDIKSVFTTPSNCSNIKISLVNETGKTDTSAFEYFQLEYGSPATEYEPYKEQTATLQYTLNAIPVSEGGNVTIDGQQYIADYVDVERKKLVRNVGQKDLSKETPNPIYSNSDTYMIMFSGYSKGGQLATTYKAYLGNVLDDNDAINKLSDLECALRYSESGSADRLYIKSSVMPDLTGLIIYYPLATPTETDLTDEEIEAFKALETYYPVTNIFVMSDQLDGATVFNYPLNMANGWNYVMEQIGETRPIIYDTEVKVLENVIDTAILTAMMEA